MLDVTRRRWRGPSRDGDPPTMVALQGTVKRVGGCRDRETPSCEDIWCEKIRGCSCGSVVFNVRYALVVTNFCSALKCRDGPSRDIPWLRAAVPPTDGVASLFCQLLLNVGVHRLGKGALNSNHRIMLDQNILLDKPEPALAGLEWGSL